MKDRIAAVLAAKFPTSKPYQITRFADNYITVMLEAIADSIRRFGFEDDQISLALNKVSGRIGRMKVSGKDVIERSSACGIGTLPYV
jgi:hypothetical protein